MLDMESGGLHSEKENIDRVAELADSDDFVLPLLGEVRWM